MTREQAVKLKADLPGYVWNGQYQQRPTAGGSGMLSIERFQRFDLSKPPKFELSIHSWDVGATIGGNASVCTKWGLAPNKDNKDALHLTQVICLRFELPEVLADQSRNRERPSRSCRHRRARGWPWPCSRTKACPVSQHIHPGPTQRRSRSRLDRPPGLAPLTQRSNDLVARSSGSKTGKC